MIRDYLIFLLHFLKVIVISIPIFRPIIIKFENRRNRYKLTISSNDPIQNEIFRVKEIYHQILNRIRDHDKDFNIKNKVILDIGSGNNLLFAFLFIINGAKQVFLIDKFRRINNNSFNFKLYNTFFKNFLKNQGKCKETLDLINYENLMKKVIYFPNKPIELFNEIKKNSIDLIFSNAVLQYISKLDYAIYKIYKLLKKGGYTIHQVDLRDLYHIYDKSYLNLLNYSKKFWKLFGNTNQYRYSYYLQLLKKYNFQIINIKYIKTNQLSKIKEIKKSFNKEYRNMSDDELSILAFNIFCKK